MAKILLFCPTYEKDGLDMFWPDSLASFRRLQSPPDVQVDRWVSRDNPFVGEGHRNTLHQFSQAHKRTLIGGYDALVTFENDMIVPEDGLIKLWATRADVAYGLYVLRHGYPVVNAMAYLGETPNTGESLTLKKKEFAASVKRGNVRVSGVGMGFTLIRRNVIERFEFHPTGESWPPDWGLGEDCQKAGLLQVCRFDVPCGHINDNGRILWPMGEDMGKVRVKILVHFVGHDGENTRPFEPGQICDIAEDQAVEYRRSGNLTILESVTPGVKVMAKPRRKLEDQDKAVK